MNFDSSNIKKRLWHDLVCPLCRRKRSVRLEHEHCADCHWAVQKKAKAILDGEACLEDMRRSPTRDAIQRAIVRMIDRGQ